MSNEIAYVDGDTVVPGAWLNAMQEVRSGFSSNVMLLASSSTSVQVAAGTGEGQTGIIINGLMRYSQVTKTLTLSGVAGTYNIFATADTADREYALTATTAATPAGFTNYRQIGTAVWNGSSITGDVVNLVGAAPTNSPLFTGSPTVPTPLTTDNSRLVINSAWVKALGYATDSLVAHLAGTETFTGVKTYTVAPRFTPTVQAGSLTVNATTTSRIITESTSGSTVTLPSGTSGLSYEVYNISSGNINITAPAGVTLNGTTAGTLILPAGWKAKLIASTTTAWIASFSGPGGGPASGTFANRPTNNLPVNTEYYATDLNITYMWNGTTWIRCAEQAGMPVWIPGWVTAPVGLLLADGGPRILRSTHVDLLNVVRKQQNATSTNGSATLTGMTSTDGMYAGMPVEMTGFAVGTTIASVVSTTSITLSNTATVSATNTLSVFPFGNAYVVGTTSTTASSTSIVVGLGSSPQNATIFALGMTVTGTGIPGGATVTGIATSIGGSAGAWTITLTISSAATATGSVTVSFSGSATLANVPDLRGRVLLGRDNAGGSIPAQRHSGTNGPGINGGAETHTNNLSEMVAWFASGAGSGYYSGAGASGGTYNDIWGSAPGGTYNWGGGRWNGTATAWNQMPPYLVGDWYIRV